MPAFSIPQFPRGSAMADSNSPPRSFGPRCYRLVGLLVALAAIFLSAPCRAQSEDEESQARTHIPDTKAGHELKWVLEAVNGGSVGDPGAKFTERFLQMVPPEALKTSLASLRER